MQLTNEPNIDIPTTQAGKPRPADMKSSAGDSAGKPATPRDEDHDIRDEDRAIDPGKRVLDRFAHASLSSNT